jgi:hypothetical protein
VTFATHPQDPFSIKIAVGIIGGGIPLLFLPRFSSYSASLWPSSEKPQCPPHTGQPIARDASAGALLPSGNKSTVSQTDRTFLAWRESAMSHERTWAVKADARTCPLLLQ